jgi:hypothetical protein
MSPKKRPSNEAITNWVTASSIKVSGTTDPAEINIARSSISQERQDELTKAIGYQVIAMRIRAEQRRINLSRELQQVEGELDIIDEMQVSLAGTNKLFRTLDQIFSYTGDKISVEILKEYARLTGQNERIPAKIFSSLQHRYSLFDHPSNLLGQDRPISIQPDQIIPNEARVFNVPALTEVYTNGDIERQPGIGSRTQLFIGNFLDEYYRQNPQAYKQLGAQPIDSSN